MYSKMKDEIETCSICVGFMVAFTAIILGSYSIHRINYDVKPTVENIKMTNKLSNITAMKVLSDATYENISRSLMNTENNLTLVYENLKEIIALNEGIEPRMQENITLCRRSIDELIEKVDNAEEKMENLLSELASLKHLVLSHNDTIHEEKKKLREQIYSLREINEAQATLLNKTETQFSDIKYNSNNNSAQDKAQWVIIAFGIPAILIIVIVIYRR